MKTKPVRYLKLECNMRNEHVGYFYALSLIDRLIGNWEGGISEQTAGYIRAEVKKALGKTDAS